jgi:general secretion pathway protein H
VIVADDKGFSLLELVVALAIAAILFVVVVPAAMHREGRSELARSARDLGAALRLTRSRAIADDRPAALLVDVGNALYRPAGAARPSAFPRGTQVRLLTTEGEALSGTVGTIRFYPDGSSTGGGVILSLGHARYDVLVDWLTGGVSLHERQAASP